MRAVAGGALVVRAVAMLAARLAFGAAVFQVLLTGIGILLIAGLWTPIVASLAAVAAAYGAFSHSGEMGFDILPGTLGVALVLLGPGAWSVDARLFGWKRVEIRNGNEKRQDRPPH